MKIVLFALLAFSIGVVSSADKNVVCYVGTWATYRHSNGKFDVENINPHLCTHLMYSFFGIELSGDLRVIDPYLDLEENWGRGNIKKFNNLKNINPQLKTIAAVGGWNEGSYKFSEVAKDPAKRRRFIESAKDFILKHNFDGLDLDWEYPARRDGDPKVDRENHVTFLKELKEELSKHNLMLTAAVSATASSSSISYNIKEISKYLDLINVMAYDLHGSWDRKIGINAPMYPSPADQTDLERELNVNSSIQYWLSQGAPPEKIVLGLPAYGRTFTLSDPNDTAVGALNNGPGLPGKYTNEPGFTGYNEICEKRKTEDWIYVWQEQQQVPYIYRGNQWIGYDDIRSVQIKSEYVVQHNLGGVMVWSLETDDFRNICGDGTYPLMRKINSIVREGAVEPEPVPTSTTPGSTSIPTHPTEVPGGEFKCTKSGTFPDPVDCAIFHICDGLVKFTFTCSDGLLFDKTILACNWPQYVDC